MVSHPPLESRHFSRHFLTWDFALPGGCRIAVGSVASRVIHRRWDTTGVSPPYRGRVPEHCADFHGGSTRILLSSPVVVSA